MEITAESFQRQKISEGCHIHRFFRNKVFYGIESEPLKRKVYRGKRDKDGKRKNEVFYVNEKQDVRIEEELLMDCVEQIMEKMMTLDDWAIDGWSGDAAHQYFMIQEKNYMRKSEKDVDAYKQFISDCIENRDCQGFENMRLRKKIQEGNFKDIIEKIEVYDTGIVCIFTNAFEMSLQF